MQVYQKQMRSLVLALAVSVSPLGPVVCDVTCAADAVDHDHGRQEGCHRHNAGAIALAVSGEDDHDCEHPDGGPAILESAGKSLPDRLVSGTPAGNVSSRTPLKAFVRAVSISSSPPHSPPPLSPLRI